MSQSELRNLIGVEYARAKASFGQRIAWRIEALAYDILTGFLRLLPLDWASGFGGFLTRCVGPLTSAHRTARLNIKLAFSDLPEEEVQRLLKAQWDNVGRTFAEFPLMDRIRPATGRVEVIGGERLAEIRDTGEPVVFISGHFANWEVMPATIVESGVPTLMTYRAMNNPYIDKRVRQGRAAYGVELFAPKGEATRDLMKGLSNGQSVALMNDQKFNAGLEVDFFGHGAHTAQGPSRLALKYGVVLQPMTAQRLKGARYRAIVHEPIRLQSTGNRQADLETAVERVNQWIETQVCDRPEEWFWVHKRWPKATYAKLEKTLSAGRRSAPKWTSKRIAIFSSLLTACVIVAAAGLWWDDILRTGLDPKVPFQTYEAPAAPDYAHSESWALPPGIATDPAGAADVFFVHPTTYDGGSDWNGPIDDPTSRDQLHHVMIPNYAGPFARAGRIFAPRYRQASLYTRLTLREDAREARAFAYQDIADAFDEYLADYDQGRPLILAGVGQGAELIARLAEETIRARPDLKARLVGVYVIDAVVAADQHGPDAILPACERRDQTGCLLAFAQERATDDEGARRRLERALVWNDNGELVNLDARAPLCVNPVLGRQSDATAPARLSLGAANATGLEWGARPPLLSRQVETVCLDGILRHSAPRSPSLQPTGSWADRRKAPPYNLFYADIEADAERRIAAFINL